MAAIYGSSSGGKKYTIGSQKGQDFVNNARPGATLTGADGSTWTKNKDGSTTIVQNGVSYTVGGSSSGGSSSGGSSSGGSSSGSRPYATDDYGDTDYSILLGDAIKSGASWQTVQGLLDQRNQKAEEKGYDRYKYDSVWQSASNYINEKKHQEQISQINAYYDQIAAQQQAAQQAAVDQAVSQLSGQKGDIEQSYDDLYRQLYIDRRMAEKNLPQQLAAMGISGGLSESTLLGTQTAYTDALRQGEQEKLGALSDIDQAISDARLTGDISLANQAAQLAINKLQSYSDLVSQLQDQNRWVTEFGANQQQNQIANSQWQQSFSRQQLLDQLSREDLSYDRKLQLAQYLYENTGDAGGFRSLGFTDAQIAALQNSYAAAMAELSAGSSSGGGGGSGTSKPVLTYAQTMDAVEHGTLTPNVLSAYAYYMGTPYQDSYTPSSDVLNRIRSLESMKGQAGSDSAIANSIAVLAAGGSITADDAAYLFRYFGYDPADYLRST